MTGGFSQFRASRTDSKLGKVSILTGGPLEAQSEYQLIDIIFHWGQDETRGSEHSVNYKSYPMEASRTINPVFATADITNYGAYTGFL